MVPPLPRLSDYDVSPVHGFLPSEDPIIRLTDHYYDPWEAVISNLQTLILTKRLREVVDTLPVLSTDLLLTEPEWRRAYSILGFIAHAYVWGGNEPCDIVPPPVSVPFLDICHHLELPPVATYAGVVLWNWRAVFPTEPIDLSNLATLTTFTGSLDESWFYLVSVAIEARAGPSIAAMIEAIGAARRNDRATIIRSLQSFAEMLDELGSLLEQMFENCDPHVFYHRIRPFLAGGKNMEAAGLPNGIMFDDGTGDQPYVEYSGGSNAQSSAIQFFDIVLGVEHRPTGEKRPAFPAKSDAPSNNFIVEMRKYMPGPHRRFLEHVESVANISNYVQAHRYDRALVVSFDAALAMLRVLRDKHIQIVSRYIVIQSRGDRGSQSRSLSPKQQRRNLANTVQRGDSRRLRGTGGTALIAFLKQARDETGEPAIDAWARRMLNNGPAEMKEDGVARLGKMNEHLDGQVEIVGLAGTWSLDGSEGGICHW